MSGRLLSVQPELFDDDQAAEVELYERPDGTRYRVERLSASRPALFTIPT